MQDIQVRTAVLIPCYNEEKTIEAVVCSFQAELPNAKIYVYDNNSPDQTYSKAQRAGALVYRELRKGKGNVLRRMFNDIEADVYVLVDGDNTYHAPSVHSLIAKLINEKLDMVVGGRIPVHEGCYRTGHQWGNRLFNFIIRCLFGRQFRDVFSGYRIFSRRFIKSFPCHSSGFEIETEMSVHALEMNLPCAEVETPYSERLPGSFSKLNTYKDGWRILKTIIKLVREVRPFLFFSILFGLCVVLSLIFFIPILLTYIDTGLVPRFPTTILVASIMLLGFLCLFSGLILESVSRARLENKRLLYLATK